MLTAKNVSEAKKISGNVVYGIRSIGDDKIVYIGKSVSLHSRFDVHKYKQKNKALAEWMKENEWEMVILEINPDDLNLSEIEWINKLKPQLFNMVHGGEQNWRHHDRKPWMAGQNVKCPSDILYTFFMNRDRCKAESMKEKLDFLRNRMDDKDRVNYELSLAKEFYFFGGGEIRKCIDKWFSQTRDRLEVFVGV